MTKSLYSISHLEQHWITLQPSGDAMRPYQIAYLTTKVTRLLSLLIRLCVNVSNRFISSSYNGKRQHNKGKKTL